MFSKTVVGAVVLLGLINGFLSESVDTSGDDRVVGGMDASIMTYPYQVSLQFYKTHYCGGSIYTNQIILTAAHCLNFTSADLPNLSVVVGTSTWNSGGIRIPIKSFAKHQYYDPSRINYDIAVIKLENQITFSETIQPVVLAKETPKNGTQTVVTGWGVTNNADSEAYSQLQRAQLDYISRAACTQYPNTYARESITPTMICAGAKDKGSCRGDSGGPLIVLPKAQQVGIVSWGRICGENGSPGVYVNIPAMLPWIESSAKKL